MLNRTHFIPGLILTSVLAVMAYILSGYVSINAHLLALLLGFVCSNVLGLSGQSFVSGVRFCEVSVLAFAVALLGVQLNVVSLLSIDLLGLVLIFSGLLFTFLVTFLLAKIFNVSASQACLIASGQGICGSAAVMASQSIIKAPAAQAGLVVALINFLGFMGVFVTVGLAQSFFAESSQSSGMLIGNTLQSMGHVVAAGFSINEPAGHFAVLIKMGRILLLIPVLLLLIFFTSKQAKKNQPGEVQIHWIKLVPMFIWVFLLLSFFTSMGWIPDHFVDILSTISKWLFLLAMVAIGLNIEIKQIYLTGGRMLFMGALVFVLQLVYSTLFLLYL